ncbi:MAG: site-specific DNA-methyltransferase [Thermoplasmata archaeon]
MNQKSSNSVSDYRPIKIYTKIASQDVSLLQQLFSLYPKEDIYFELSSDGLIIYLRELDFFNFKKNIYSLIKNADDNTAKLLNSIFFSIDRIKSYGLKGRKRLYVGYDKERKVKNRQEKEIIRGMYYYARDNNFSKQNNKVPEEFVNKIIVGDSEEILKRFPDNCIDLIFTSPPYNFGLDYETHKDGINWDDYFRKLFAIFQECIRVLKYGGRIIVNVQPLFSDYIPIHHIISNFFIKNKLIWKGEILWDKHNYNCKYTAWGSWKSPSNPYLKYTWEFLEIFSKGDLKHPGNREMADITDDEFKKWVYARWDIPPEYNMKKYGHPAMFPEQLVERVLKLFSFKGDTVLDPFNGVGTTTAVAKRLSRNYIGIDISEEYCKKAEERLKNTHIITNLFMEG